jgi:membrane-associated two-gene conflict system component 1 (EACC1)
MGAQIRVSGGDDIEEFTDLWEWLRLERALTGTVQAVRPTPSDGELGGAFDMLAVALGSGGAGMALARSLMAWLRTRRPSVTVTVETKAGTVTVAARDVDRADVLPLLDRVLRNGDA